MHLCKIHLVYRNRITPSVYFVPRSSGCQLHRGYRDTVADSSQHHCVCRGCGELESRSSLDDPQKVAGA